MGHGAEEQRLSSVRAVAAAAVAALVAIAMMLMLSTGAGAASLVAKDGLIHACVKAKGKGKGTLRVVRNSKAKCPRGWKKTAWNAAGPAGSGGANGENGGSGGSGESGAGGANGTTGATSTTAKVSSLETQVTDLLAKVKSLEGILSGVNNAQLKEAIGAVPVVQTLCGQAKSLNEQSTKLGESTQALNAVLTPLLIAFAPVSVPTALPAFACP
jgi:hypothetical protein